MPLLWIAFFLSGVAGLSYELAWVRYLQQLFGASLPAISTTVAIFFAGLALGSGLLGSRFDAARSPRRAYAILELGIAALASLVPLSFSLAERLLGRAQTDGPFTLVLVSGLLLLPVTVLLGATFPAMAAVVREVGRSGTHGVGLFYGLNTLGAVLGSLIASFVLIPELGQARTTWCMTGANLAAAALLLLSARPAAPRVEVSQSPESRGRLSPRLALVLAAGSGLLGLAAEVLWTRIVSLSFLPSVQVFSLVLTAYLIGIGLGSLLVGRFHRRRLASPATLFAVLVAAGLGNAITLLLLPRVSPALVGLIQAGTLQSWAGYLIAVGLGVLLAVLPSTIAMGASLPLIVGLAGGGQSSRLAGRLYAANVMAGVVGSLGGVFLLMPALGLSCSLLLLAAAYLGLALLIAGPGRLPVVGLLLALLLVCLIGEAPSANPYRGLLGGRVLLQRDEPAGSIEVSQDEAGVRHLRINNFHGLSNSEPATVAMQYGLGHLPLLLHREPRRALLIGLGTGATLAAMAEHSLDQLHAVEILPSLREHLTYFESVNGGVLDDRRVRLIIDDGRRYLSRRGPPYDVIVGDLFLPQHPGVGALYTEEHFRATRRRLSGSGLLLAWLPLFQLGPAEVASIVQSFLGAFPDAEGWAGSWSRGSPVLGLLGRVAPPSASGRLGSEQLARAYQQRQRASLLRAFPGGPGAELWSRLLPPRRLLGPGDLQRLAGQAPPNRLEHPVIEFQAPRALFLERVGQQRLAEQNLRRLAELVPLAGTPWELR